MTGIALRGVEVIINPGVIVITGSTLAEIRTACDMLVLETRPGAPTTTRTTTGAAPTPAAHPAKKKRTVSAAARRVLSIAQKKRWAEKHAAATGTAPAGPTPTATTKRTRTAPPRTATAGA